MKIRHALALAFIAACYAVAGTLDYNAARAQAQANARPADQVARVWSKRCERLGRDTLVKQADGGKVEIHCLPRRVLTVAAQ